MRKFVVVFTILTVLVAGCSKQQKPTPSATHSEPSTTVAIPSYAIPRDFSPASTLELGSTTTTEDTPVSTVRCSHGAAAANVASAFVATLILGGTGNGLPNGELWQHALAGGSVVQTTPLSEAAGRATVAVSVAFESASDAAITDPIGLRIELVEIDECWQVESVGYL